MGPRGWVRPGGSLAAVLWIIIVCGISGVLGTFY